MSGPSIQRLGSAVLLQGPALAAARYAVGIAQRGRRSNGYAPSPTLTELEQALEAAEGRADVLIIPADAVSKSALAEPISTTEAARILGRSTRQVRRIAVSLDGHRIGGAWWFDRQTVIDYRNEQNR